MRIPSGNPKDTPKIPSGNPKDTPRIPLGYLAETIDPVLWLYWPKG